MPLKFDQVIFDPAIFDPGSAATPRRAGKFAGDVMGGEQLGFFRISNLSSAVALSSLTGAAALDADGVAVQAETGNVRVRCDGTTANATTGQLIVANDPPVIVRTGPCDATALARITLIEADAGATANVILLRAPRVSKEF